MPDSFSTKIRRLNKSFSQLANCSKNTNAAFLVEAIIEKNLSKLESYFSHSPKEFREFWQIYAEFVEIRSTIM